MSLTYYNVSFVLLIIKIFVDFYIDNLDNKTLIKNKFYIQ